MKNTRKGFIVPLLIVIITVLVVGGGIYFYLISNNGGGIQQHNPMRVVSPNGGEVFKKGTTQTIGWFYDGAPTNRPVRLFVMKNSIPGGTFITSLSLVAGQEQTYNWKIPTDFLDGTDYKIEVDLEKTSDSDALIYDDSDSGFSIYTSVSSSQTVSQPVKKETKPVVNTAPVAPVVSTQISCTDSDNGDDYYTKGQVSYSEPITLKENAGVQVLSSASAKVRGGNIVAVGGNYSFVEPDQVIYPKPDGTNGNLMVNIPITDIVNKINFSSVGNANNSISVTRSEVLVDSCVGNVLVENSCVRGINTGYYCSKGCMEGACIR